MISFIVGLIIGVILMCLLQINKTQDSQQRIDKALKYTHEMLGFLENCVSGNEQEIQNCIKIFNKYLEILKGEE